MCSAPLYSSDGPRQRPLGKLYHRSGLAWTLSASDATKLLWVLMDWNAVERSGLKRSGKNIGEIGPGMYVLECLLKVNSLGEHRFGHARKHGWQCSGCALPQESWED